MPDITSIVPNFCKSQYKHMKKLKHEHFNHKRNVQTEIR